MKTPLTVAALVIVAAASGFAGGRAASPEPDNKAVRCLSLYVGQMAVQDDGGNSRFMWNEFDRLGCRATLGATGFPGD